MWWVFLQEKSRNVLPLNDSGEEFVSFDQDAPPTSKTRSGKQYLKKYDEAVASLAKPTKETTEQSTKQPVEKQKELCYTKALQKDDAEWSTTPFRYDVLTQLANIPTQITLYELLRLSNSTREALRKALADSEAYINQIPTVREEEDDGHCHKTSKHFLCITFTPDDIQIKEKHDRPVYYTGYIGSSEVNHFQVDSGFALSIMPHRVLQHLGIPTHRPSATQTAIYASTPMVHAR